MNIERQIERSNRIEVESIISSQDDMITESLQETRGEPPSYPYVGKPAIILSIMQILLQCGLISTAFALPHLYPSTDEDVRNRVSFNCVLYAHCATWLLDLLADVLFSIHHRKLKMKGYLHLYRSIKYLQKHPFYVKSFGITANLAFVSQILSLCKVVEEPHSYCQLLSLRPIQWAQILVSLESAVMFIGHILLFGRIMSHNRGSRAPDDAEERMLLSFQHHINGANGIGFRADDLTDDVIERQADRIRGLQEQINFMNKKLFTLTQQQREVTVHGTPR